MKIQITMLMLIISMLFASCSAPADTSSDDQSVEVITETVNIAAPKRPNLKLPDNLMQTSVGAFNIAYSIEDNSLVIKGNLGSTTSSYLLVGFDVTDEGKHSTEITDNCFETSIDIPDSHDELAVNLFLGDAQYGNFDGLLCNVVRIEKNQDKWVFKESPVLDENIDIYTQTKNPDDYLDHSEYIQSQDDEIKALSNLLTKDCDNDYQKIIKIHDWIAQNIYYDFDAFFANNYPPADALSVLHSKRAVCEGFANLFAALARAQNIPCRTQNGYALGVGTDGEWTQDNTTTDEINHSWNEVYFDGRWMIVDATWDTKNKIENGQVITGKEINYNYFDSDINFFSLTHRSIE